MRVFGTLTIMSDLDQQILGSVMRHLELSNCCQNFVWVCISHTSLSHMIPKAVRRSNPYYDVYDRMTVNMIVDVHASSFRTRETVQHTAVTANSVSGNSAGKKVVSR